MIISGISLTTAFNEIPSDLTTDHHPHRNCEYTLTYAESNKASTNTEADEDDSKWIINDTCISDLCFKLKSTTSQIVEHANPARTSDIRTLVLNNIYIFNKNSTFSVTKCFPDAIHTTLKPALFFETYVRTKGLNCYDWCQEIEAYPPVDWSSSLSLCAELLTTACKSENPLDMHTAQVLTEILPVLTNGPPDDTTKDSYVHYYLPPLLSSVFASDSRLKMKWSNSQLKDNTLDAFKPDFSVYNLSGSTTCVVLIADFKPKEKNSCIESDLVKLAKEINFTLDTLAINGVSKPKVCGIHCEGQNMYTFVMDMPSPKLYRMCNVSKIKLFNNLDQISLLSSVLSHFLYLKTIASQTAAKIEAAVLYKYDNLKRPSPVPPTDWLSNGSVTVSHIPKKIKTKNYSFRIL